MGGSPRFPAVAPSRRRIPTRAQGRPLRCAGGRAPAPPAVGRPQVPQLQASRPVPEAPGASLSALNRWPRRGRAGGRVAAPARALARGRAAGAEARIRSRGPAPAPAPPAVGLPGRSGARWYLAQAPGATAGGVSTPRAGCWCGGGRGGGRGGAGEGSGGGGESGGRGSVSRGDSVPGRPSALGPRPMFPAPPGRRGRGAGRVLGRPLPPPAARGRWRCGCAPPGSRKLATPRDPGSWKARYQLWGYGRSEGRRPGAVPLPALIHASPPPAHPGALVQVSQGVAHVTVAPRPPPYEVARPSTSTP